MLAHDVVDAAELCLLVEGLAVVADKEAGDMDVEDTEDMEVAEVAEEKKEVTSIILYYCVILQLHYEHSITIEYECCYSIVVTTYFKMSNCVPM